MRRWLAPSVLLAVIAAVVVVEVRARRPRPPQPATCEQGISSMRGSRL